MNLIHKKISLLLIAILSLYSMTVSAIDIKEIIDLIEKDEKRLAWQIAYVEAENGDAEALYALGLIMEKSPELDKHLYAAHKYYQFAAKRGYKIAEHHADRIRAKFKEKKAAEASKKVIESRISAYKQLREDYLEKQDEKFSSVKHNQRYAEFHVFIDTLDSSFDDITEKLAPLKNKYRNTHWVFYVNDENSLMEANHKFPELDFTPPEHGFEPDGDKVHAEQYGVKTYPSVVVKTSFKEFKTYSLNQITKTFN